MSTFHEVGDPDSTESIGSAEGEGSGAARAVDRERSGATDEGICRDGVVGGVQNGVGVPTERHCDGAVDECPGAAGLQGASIEENLIRGERTARIQEKALGNQSAAIEHHLVGARTCVGVCSLAHLDLGGSHRAATADNELVKDIRSGAGEFNSPETCGAAVDDSLVRIVGSIGLVHAKLDAAEDRRPCGLDELIEAVGSRRPHQEGCSNHGSSIVGDHVIGGATASSVDIVGRGQGGAASSKGDDIGGRGHKAADEGSCIDRAGIGDHGAVGDDHLGQAVGAGDVQGVRPCIRGPIDVEKDGSVALGRHRIDTDRPGCSRHKGARVDGGRAGVAVGGGQGFRSRSGLDQGNGARSGHNRSGISTGAVTGTDGQCG